MLQLLDIIDTLWRLEIQSAALAFTCTATLSFLELLLSWIEGYVQPNIVKLCITLPKTVFGSCRKQDGTLSGVDWITHTSDKLSWYVKKMTGLFHHSHCETDAMKTYGQHSKHIYLLLLAAHNVQIIDVLHSLCVAQAKNKTLVDPPDVVINY